MPRISVIIPVYNTEKYLKECLDSVISQTFYDIEIICVNDGSKDNSLSILKEYTQKDSRIKVINQENSGVIAARNNGIKEANSEYIFPLDSDDYIAPTCLEKLYKVIDQGIFDVVYSKVNFFGNKTGEFVLPIPDKKIMYNTNCVVCSALYKKKDWEKYGGYDPLMKNGYEDWEFWVNFIEDNKEFFCVNDALFFYRQRENSRNNAVISCNPNHEKLKNYIQEKHRKLKNDIPGWKFNFLTLLKLYYLKLTNKSRFEKKFEIYKNRYIDYKDKKNPRIILLLLIKDETELLEENLLSHKKIGFDGVIVTNKTNSQKINTIIKKYEDNGFILHSFSDVNSYSDRFLLHRMFILARSKFNADWIFQGNPNEFLNIDEACNIKKYLNVKSNRIVIQIHKKYWSRKKLFFIKCMCLLCSMFKKVSLKKKDSVILRKLLKYRDIRKKLNKSIIRASDYKNLGVDFDCYDLVFNNVEKISCPHITIHKQ